MWISVFNRTTISISICISLYRKRENLAIFWELALLNQNGQIFLSTVWKSATVLQLNRFGQNFSSQSQVLANTQFLLYPCLPAAPHNHFAGDFLFFRLRCSVLFFGQSTGELKTLLLIYLSLFVSAYVSKFLPSRLTVQRMYLTKKKRT